MAPNAEEEMLAIKPWGLQQEKERLRPPTYNAEDYVMALRRWGRRPLTSVHDSQGTLPSTTSSSSGYVSGGGEMTLRQFTSVSELLNKLRADLRLAFPSFVQEFASDGVTLLLETLRGVQLAQSTPPSGQSGPRIGTRKAALDELGCVECLAACAERCADVPRLLSQAQPGLLALAICLTSSLNRSRVLALQLLTKVCQIPGGHGAVSEAVSTLRLRYGEGGRFRFLAGALLAPQAAIALRVAGIAFLNAFLKSAPRTQTRLYIQAEACEAGLEPRVLQEWLNEVDGRSEEQTLTDLLKKEIYKWSQNCVDVDALQKRLARAEETCAILGNKVTQLQDQLNKIQLKTRNGYNLDERNVQSILMDNHDLQRLSSNGEDEGISSSERSSSPEQDLNQSSSSNSNRPMKNKIDNDQETTIDDVIEELRIIVKDAEEEDRKDQQNVKDDYISNKKLIKESASIKTNNIQTFSNENSDYGFKMDNKKLMGKTNVDSDSLKIVVKGPDVEEAIVPAILYPQPPRRSPPCLSSIIAPRSNEYNIEHDSDIYNCHDDEDGEEETGDGSDSLLSASRLKYNKKNSNKCTEMEGRLYLSKNGVTSKDSGSLYQREEKIERKTIRNFNGGLKSLQNTDKNPKHLDVYRQFEPTAIGRINEHNRYKSEFERKKMLRRAVSDDYLDSECSNDLTKCNKIEGKIRKFESMNSFDNSLMSNLTRNNSNLSRRRKTYDKDNSKNKIRRSESCHQVSYSIRKESYNTHGGSDSGLHYTTDYDLEPVLLPRQFNRPEVSEANQLTKSLDRIDEGLDTFVDIVVSGGVKPSHRSLNNRPLNEKNQKNNSKRLDDKCKNKTKTDKNPSARKNSDKEIKSGTKVSENHLKGDQYCNGFYNSSVLKNDELYKVDRYHSRSFNQLNTCTNKVPNFSSENNLPLISSFPYEVKSSKKMLINDSGVFLSASNKPYDVFGLGKNRNAGKYSGNPPPPPPPPIDNSLGLRKNSSTAKHSKVTDIISGLY